MPVPHALARSENRTGWAACSDGVHEKMWKERGAECACARVVPGRWEESAKDEREGTQRVFVCTEGGGGEGCGQYSNEKNGHWPIPKLEPSSSSFA